MLFNEENSWMTWLFLEKNCENTLFTKNEIEQMLFNITCKSYVFQINKSRASRRQFKS